MHEPTSETTTNEGEQADSLSFAQEHPIAMGVLAFAMVGGGIAGYIYFGEILSPVRSVLGGAVAGFGCWLLVMVGRVIGE